MFSLCTIGWDSRVWGGGLMSPINPESSAHHHTIGTHCQGYCLLICASVRGTVNVGLWGGFSRLAAPSVYVVFLQSSDKFDFLGSPFRPTLFRIPSWMIFEVCLNVPITSHIHRWPLPAHKKYGVWVLLSSSQLPVSGGNLRISSQPVLLYSNSRGFSNSPQGSPLMDAPQLMAGYTQYKFKISQVRARV